MARRAALLLALAAASAKVVFKAPVAGSSSNCMPLELSPARLAALKALNVEILGKLANAHVGLLGHQDVERVSSVLSAVYPQDASRTKPFIIDAGANVGQSSDAILHAFTELTCRDRFGSFCAASNVDVYALEPVSVVFERMMNNSRPTWQEVGWKPRRIGLGDFSGRATMHYMPSFANFQESSLSPCSTMAFRRYPEMMATQEVAIVTYADFVAIEGLGNRDCFLLKLDLEGYDGPALDGAMALVAAGKVHFILFEYAFKIFCPGYRHTLKGMVASLLDEGGMECYVITPTLLVPIFGYWWDDSYENQEHMNVLCGRVSDPATRLAVAAFNRGRNLPFASPHTYPDVTGADIDALKAEFPVKHYEVILVPLDPAISGRVDAKAAKHRFWPNAPPRAADGTPAPPQVVYDGLPPVTASEVGGFIGAAEQIIQAVRQRVAQNDPTGEKRAQMQNMDHALTTAAMSLDEIPFPQTRFLT